jgi:uncharacterized membrane protein (DUF485 family)
MQTSTDVYPPQEIPKSATLRLLRVGIGALLLAVVTFLTFQLVQLLGVSRATKIDLAEISHIRYGLLNADEWVKLATGILTKKVDEFDLTQGNKEELKKSVEKILDQIIVEVDRIIREKNQEGGTWWENLVGGVKQFLTDVLVDIRSLRDNVPKFTNIVLAELDKPGAKEKLKEHISQKIHELAQKSFTTIDLTQYDAALKRHGCSEKQHCQSLLTTKLEVASRQISRYAIVIIVLVLVFFVIVLWRNPHFDRHQMELITLMCAVLLLGGILTPMIEIEAKISELSFQLLGESVVFKDQLLYFQSKSITDVVTLLVQTGSFDMIFVGLLISLFSIAFPITKLVSSLVYYHNIGNLKHHPLVKFFALKSSKWAMADVLVVALFMAYIGFSGLISSQLSHLQQATKHIEVLTTNGTTLQVGFFLFLSFCLAGLVLSAVLEKQAER